MKTPKRIETPIETFRINHLNRNRFSGRPVKIQRIIIATATDYMRTRYTSHNFQKRRRSIPTRVYFTTRGVV